MMYSTNYLGLLLAAVVAMVVGYVWYGPLFGKTWMKLMGMKEAKMKGAGTSYLVMYVVAVVEAYVLSVFMKNAGATTVNSAAMVAFWAWLGFVATVMLGMVLWDKKPLNLYFLNVAYQLVTMVLMAVVLVLI